MDKQKSTRFAINSSKIGIVIGQRGKTIREIIKDTGTTIDIEPDGWVTISGESDENIQKASEWVKILAGGVEAGSIYQGKVKRFADFGIFVELVPGKDGLVHSSNIPEEFQRTFAKEYQIGETVSVEVIDSDPATGRIRLRMLK